MVSAVSNRSGDSGAVLPADDNDVPPGPSTKLQASQPVHITMGVGTVLGLRAATLPTHINGTAEVSRLATVAAALARLAASEDAAGE
jgi:hypothetical protein